MIICHAGADTSKIYALKVLFPALKEQVSDKPRLKKMPYLRKITRNRAERAGIFDFKYKGLKKLYSLRKRGI